MKYFEDVERGDGGSGGEYEVTREEMVAFAERYDPQPIHLEDEQGADAAFDGNGETDAAFDDDGEGDAVFDGLVASGWYTAAVTMGLLVDHVLDSRGILGAVGVDDLRWRTPVEPGDVLAVEARVREKEVWDDDRGLVRLGVETTNQSGDPVLTMVGLVLWRRRPVEGST